MFVRIPRILFRLRDLIILCFDKIWSNTQYICGYKSSEYELFIMKQCALHKQVFDTGYQLLSNAH